MIFTVDIGTSNFKSAVFDLNGNRIDFFIAPLEINCNPEQWIKAYESSLKEFNLFDKNALIKKIKAIVITGHGPTLVPVLQDETVGKAQFWLDTKEENPYLDEVSKIMGGFVHSSFFLPKILNIKNNDLELYLKTKHFLGCPEYLAYFLTGKPKTVFPSDGFDRWFWNDEVLNKLQLDKEKFPPFIRPGDVFAFLDSIPVISGGPDFFSAILGAGITKPGQALNRTGSSEGINLCTKIKSESKNLWMSYAHPIKPYFNLSGIIRESGIKIEKESIKTGFSNIKEFIESDKSNSIIESICYEMLDIINKMEEAGNKVNEIRVTGGLSKYKKIIDIKMRITGKNIVILENKEAELLGCAIIGLCYLGKFSDYKEACKSLVKIKDIYELN